MNNKIRRRGLLKPFSMLFLACLLIFTLTSCGKKKNLYSGIDTDSNYVTVGNYSVTNGEMFDSFKWSSSSIISNKINETIIYKYLEDVKKTIENPTTDVELANHDKYIAGVHDYLVMDLYAVDSAELADEINNPYMIVQLKAKFQDAVYQNYNITLSTAQIEQLALREDGESAIDYDSLTNKQKTVFSKYYDSYASKLFAKDYLKDEIKDYEDDMDEDDDPYYTDSEIKTYWTNNYEYNYDLKSILIRFISQDEVNQVLKAFGLKTYRSRLYFVKQTDVEKPNAAQSTLSNEAYSTWYDDYDFALQSNYSNSVDLTSLNPTLILSLYVEMYNYVYSYRTPLNNVDLSGVAKDTSSRRNVTAALIDKFRSDEDLSEMTYTEFYDAYLSTSDYVLYNGERLEDMSSSLKSYVYTTLDLNKSDSNYSIAGQSYGDYYYMAFKIEDANVPDSEKLYYTDEDEEEIDHTKNTELLDSIIDELMDEELTESYISNAISEAKKDTKVRIYDKNIEIAYMAQDSSYSKNRKDCPEDGVLVRIKYDGTTLDLTATELWTELEPSNGYSTMIDIISKKMIKDTTVYAEVKADKELTDGYYDTLNNLLANFAAGQLASYGYDASLGKYNFLMLYFHTTDIKEIINDFYCISEASSKLLNDYSSEALANLLKSSAANYFDQYFSISATNLLVYVDMDEDGSPDKDFDWTSTVANPFEGVTTYADLAKSLISDVIDIIDNSASSDVETLTAIITEYNSSSRFGNGYNSSVSEDGSYDPTEAEKYWAKYRVNGLLIKSQDLASITNSSDYATVYDTLKIAMFDAYNDASYLFDDETVPTEYLVTKYYEGTNSGLLTVDGYNLFTLTGATVNADSEFTEEDDVNGLYKDLVYIYNDVAYMISDLYSEDGYLTLNQVRAYLLEYVTNSTTVSMPTVVSTALTTYLKPIYDRFSSNASQFAVLLGYIEAAGNVDGIEGFVFGDFELITATTERFNEILKINERTQDSYVVTENIYGSDCKYTFFTSDTAEEYVGILADIENLYGNWWNELATYASNAFVKGE